VGEDDAKMTSRMLTALSFSNNLTFGAGGKNGDGSFEAGWGYYETIAGGSGAGEGWHGESGVHTQ
jgi:N-methylhydantoinase B/oxoprolinase/acetone carboxylase alpha subunit